MSILLGFLITFSVSRYWTNTTHRITSYQRVTHVSSCSRCPVTHANRCYGKNSNMPYTSAAPLTRMTMPAWPWREKSWWAVRRRPAKTRRIFTVWSPTEKSWTPIQVSSKPVNFAFLVELLHYMTCFWIDFWTLFEFLFFRDYKLILVHFCRIMYEWRHTCDS